MEAAGTGLILVSALLFGSTFALIKRYDTYDGVFVQLLICSGQFVVGVASAGIAGFPPLYPIAMLGGVIYGIANILSILTMSYLGLAIGPLVWNSVTCVVGWAVSRFGLLGNERISPASDVLNISGVAIICVGGACFAIAKNTPVSVRPAPVPKEISPASCDQCVGRDNSEKTIRVVSPQKRTLLLCVCVVIGCLFGILSTPINYMVRYHEYYHTPSEVTPYLFSYFTGAFLTSLVIFIAYCMYRRNVPVLNPECALPSFVAGLTYATATCAFFAANQILGQIIVYPVICITPGMVATMWSIFWFKEIKGRTNYMKLLLGYLTTSVGLVCIVLSKIEFRNVF